MGALDLIKRPIKHEMSEFDVRFRDHLSSNVPLVDRVMRYMVKRKGKQLRPILVFLSAKIQGSVTNSTYVGASLVEIMHTATLVHDDVVDDADQRRGFFSINALWKNKIAVLIGDYLLSKVLLLAVETKEYVLLEHVSGAVKAMSEGELLQIEKARKLDITEEVYFEIIQQKTASLLETCCVVGASSAGASPEEIEKFRNLGRHLGLAFQIKDDLFDYGETAIGKPTGIDIKEQKMTLPLIYTLNNVSTAEKNWLIQSVKKYNRDKKRVRQVIEKVKSAGGLTYAEKKMEENRQKALDLLLEFPQDSYRDALELMVNYVISRKQ